MLLPYASSIVELAVLVQGSREKTLNPQDRCLVLGAQISRLRSTRSRASLIAPQGLLQRTFWTGGPFIAFMTMGARMRENELSSGSLCRPAKSDPESAAICYACVLRGCIFYFTFSLAALVALATIVKSCHCSSRSVR